MGFFSSDESAAVKTSDTQGNISNNIVLTKNADRTMEVLMIVLTILKLLEFVMLIYSNFIRKIKKRYNGAQSN